MFLVTYFNWLSYTFLFFPILFSEKILNILFVVVPCEKLMKTLLFPPEND